MLPAPHVTLSMSGKIASILGPHYGWSSWKNEDLLADLVEFFCSRCAVQRSLWAKLEKRVPVSEAEKKRRRTEAANAVKPLSVVELVLLLKNPEEGIIARALHVTSRALPLIARASLTSARATFSCCARYFPQVQRFGYLDEK